MSAVKAAAAIASPVQRRAIILARFYVACFEGSAAPSATKLARMMCVPLSNVERDISTMVAGAEMIREDKGGLTRFMVCGRWSAWAGGAA